MNRVMFIGQAPSRCGRKIARLLGVSTNDLILFGFFNLNACRAKEFDFEIGRRTAKRLEWTLADRCVLLGQKVARCFDLKLEPLKRAKAYGVEFLLLPHPSGVNRWWNDKANVERAKRALRKFVL